MSTQLERRYRRALAWYPKAWREANADVMVGTLLDVAEADDRTHPRVGELVGLAASGFSTRLGTFLEPSARNAISTIALATGVAYLLAYFVLQFWSTSTAVPYWMGPDQSAANFVWPKIDSGLIIVAVWALAFILALRRRQRGLRSVTAIAILAAIAFSLINRFPGVSADWYGLTTTSLVFLGLLGMLVLLGTPRHGMRIALYAAGAFACIVVADIAIRYSFHGDINEHRLWMNAARIFIPALCVAALAAIVYGIIHRTGIAHTIAISMIPWIAAWLLVELTQHELWSSLAFVGIVTALVLFGAALSAALQRTSATRRENLTKF